MAGENPQEDAPVESTVSWPEEAPDVVLGGVHVARSLLVPEADEDEEEGHSGEAATWSISYASVLRGEERLVLFIGDYGQSCGPMYAAATVTVMVKFRGAALERLEQDLHRTAEIYAPWASHVLWDAIRLRIVALLASSPRPADVPVLTPQFSLHAAASAEEEAPTSTGTQASKRDGS